MPKFSKPDSPNIIWGVNALEGNLTKPSDDYIQTGWTQVKPPYEYENYSMNKLYQGFAYYNQLGIPEWDSTTEYQSGKSYVQGSDSRVYKCIQTHVSRNPTTAGNEAFWEVFEGNRQATELKSGTVKLASETTAKAGVEANTAISPFTLFQTIASGNVAEKGEIKIPLNDNGIKKYLHVQWGVYLSSASGKTTATFTNPFENTHIGSTGSFFGGFIQSQGATVKIEKIDKTSFNFAVVSDLGAFTESPVFIIHIGT